MIQHDLSEERKYFYKDDLSAHMLSIKTNVKELNSEIAKKKLQEAVHFDQGSISGLEWGWIMFQ